MVFSITSPQPLSYQRGALQNTIYFPPSLRGEGAGGRGYNIKRKTPFIPLTERA
jgi:hypothetical protein